MKQAMKRFGAMLLTMAMLLSLAVTGVSAEGETPTQSTTGGKTVNITFNGLDEDTLTGYQVIKYTDNSYNAFEGANGIKNGDQNFWDYVKDTEKFKNSSAADPAEYLKNNVTTNSDDLRGLLKDFLTTGESAELTKTSAFSATNGIPTTVAPGYYILQVVSSSKIYNTMLLFVGYENGQLVAKMDGNDMQNSPYMSGSTEAGYTATVKSQDGPTVEKYVFDDHKVEGTVDLKAAGNWKSAAAAKVGDEVNFAIKVELPIYPNDANVTLILKDTQQNLQYTGIDFNSIKVYYKSGEDKYSEVTNAVSGAPDTYNSATGKQTMDITLNYGALKNTTATEFYVYYKATLKENAVAGDNHNGTNTVTLDYSVKTSAGTYTGTPLAKVDVYTYNFDLTKYYNGDADGKHETSAEFSVFTAVSGNDVDNSSVMKFKKVTDADSKKEYYYPVAATEIGDGIFTEIPADFEIRGLDVSTPYYVKEVETPAGYYAPSSYFTLQLSGKEKSTTDTTLTDVLTYDSNDNYADPSSFVAEDETKDQVLVRNTRADAVENKGNYGAINGTNKYQYDVILNNSSTPVLPSTGGMGTTLFTVGGVALLALAAAMLILRRRKN